MKVEIWSDFMCPFCYIGKRRFESALEQFPHKDQVEVVYRSFELDPNASYKPDVSMDELLAAKYGMSIEQAKAANANVTQQAAGVGLTYHMDRVIPANSFDAHRLVYFADQHGKMKEMTERLFRAYFTDAENLEDRNLLADLAAEVGLSRELAAAALESDDFQSEVRTDEAAAANMGIRGVPFFVLGGKYAVSGAQPLEVFTDALDKAYREANPLVMVNEADSNDGMCADGSCDLPNSSK
ncbi:DsbA family oxidoreductase [Paenibacillus glucanolyticus]|jgi:predicted DsbA family dithiol-disulfide isomerase|uniref:DsbA family oxidoreductase n=1 Tax=Paenibacillus TaxID=44249 RepID=UPI0003E201C9|nr:MULTISPECIES: DsbA family oxidoreductase [Paenibacillus]ANA82991.1 disulfide bond formation protein DsbA [Paenibacillus glucanolyticus]AVV57921.1 DsbA family oxidoreductase [Paenibacillus glucanolyticus]ETT34716.1 DSBA oxidoreductase [Paenibacillus sp. FSL R5-808]OMF83393.1 disulfide bond formation protein DsbA [Paenibacillus glucanolyticus]